MSDQSHSPELPPIIAGRLNYLRRTAARLRSLEGVLLAATVLLVAMLLAMGIDWLIVLFNAGWRTALTAAALTAPLVVLVQYVLWPLLRPASISAAARDVDRAVPALEERWSTLAEISESSDPPAVRGAPALVQQVRGEAVALSELVEDELVLSRETLRRRGRLLAAVAIILLAALVLNPRRTAVLVARFWLPQSELTATRISTAPGDMVIARGEPLDLTGRIEGVLPSTATLQVRWGETPHDSDATGESNAAKGNSERIRLVVSPTGEFVWQIRAAQQPFEYRVRAGDAQTPWHRVRVEDRPCISKVLLRIEPPDYTRLAADERDTLPGRCRALRGSRLTLSFQANKPLARTELRLENGQTEPLTATIGNWYRFYTLLDKTFAFSVILTDSAGLTNVPPPSCRVLVYEDQPPSVQIVSPGDDEVSAPPDASLEVAFKAADDFGIVSAELVVSSGEGASEKLEAQIDIPLTAQTGSRAVRGKAKLDLASLKLQDGQMLNYAVRVTDTSSMTSISRGSLRGDAPPGSSTRPSEQQASAADPGSPTTAAAEGAEKANTPQEQASSQPSASMPSLADGGNLSSQPAEPSDSPPPNRMTRRLFDVRSGQGCSGRQRIKVDRWAGSFDGQAREKLQLSIRAYLERLDKSLAAAEPPVKQMIQHTTSRPAPPDALPLRRADGHLKDGLATIAELKNISNDTPYTFVGLQLHEIGIAHVSPARTLVGDITQSADAAAQSKNLQQAEFHIDRARAMLAKLSGEFEQLVRQEKIESALREFATMHQIFLEDMYKLLAAAGKPRINSRTGKGLEVSDEYVQKLREKYEKLKELLAELSKILAQDPDLLRRFMARTRLEGTTLRDQLTLLARRQSALRTDVDEWLATPPSERPARQISMIAARAAEQSELAKDAAQLSENVETWKPRDLDAAKGPLADVRRQATEIAMSAPAVAAAMSGEDVEKGLSLARELDNRLEELAGSLQKTLDGQPQHEKLAMFVTNRLEEIARLRVRLTGIIDRLQFLRRGDFGRSAAVEQRQLEVDTAELGDKLIRVESMLAGLSPEAGEKAHQLATIVNQKIAPDQQEATRELQERIQDAPVRQSSLVTRFAEAEKTFDELLSLVEANAQAPTTTQMCELPTLEQLLKALENEARACEKLGAVIKLNISLQTDWFTPDNGSGSGSGQGEGSGSGQAYGNLGSALANAAREYARQARREWQRSGASGTSSQPEDSDRDWNTFVSKLREELQQSRDSLPPEQYQQAIDAYFRILPHMTPDSAPSE